MHGAVVIASTEPLGRRHDSRGALRQESVGLVVELRTDGVLR